MNTAKSIQRPVLPDPPPQPDPEGYFKPAENRSIVIVWLRTFAWGVGGVLAFVGGIGVLFSVPIVLCGEAWDRGDRWEAAAWMLIPFVSFFAIFATLHAVSVRDVQRARCRHEAENARRRVAGEWPLPPKV